MSQTQVHARQGNDPDGPLTSSPHVPFGTRASRPEGKGGEEGNKREGKKRLPKQGFFTKQEKKRKTKEYKQKRKKRAKLHTLPGSVAASNTEG